MTGSAKTIFSRTLLGVSIVFSTIALVTLWQARKLRAQLQGGAPISYTRTCTNVTQCGCPNFDAVIAGGVECDNSEMVSGIQQFGHATFLAASRPDASGTGWVGRCIRLGTGLGQVELPYDCGRLGCKHDLFAPQTVISFNHDVTPSTIWIRCSAVEPR